MKRFGLIASFALVAFVVSAGSYDSSVTAVSSQATVQLTVDYTDFTPSSVVAIDAEIPETLVIVAPELGGKKPVDVLVAGKLAKVTVNRIRPPPGLGLKS